MWFVAFATILALGIGFYKFRSTAPKSKQAIDPKSLGTVPPRTSPGFDPEDNPRPADDGQVGGPLKFFSDPPDSPHSVPQPNHPPEEGSNPNQDSLQWDRPEENPPSFPQPETFQAPEPVNPDFPPSDYESPQEPPQNAEDFSPPDFEPIPPTQGDFQEEPPPPPVEPIDPQDYVSPEDSDFR